MKKYIALAFVFFACQQTQGTDLKDHSAHDQKIANYKEMAKKLQENIQEIVKGPYYSSENIDIFNLVEYLAPVCTTLNKLSQSIPANDEKIKDIPKLLILERNIGIQQYYKIMENNIRKSIFIINELVKYISEQEEVTKEISMLNRQLHSLGENLMPIFSTYSNLLKENS